MSSTLPMLLQTVRDAVELLGPLVRARSEERLAIAFLDAGGKVLGTISRAGSEDEVELPIREVIAAGLRLNSRAMILAHNHPSGDCTPSAGDLAVTRRLAQTGEAVDMRLHDHLVFGGEGYTSMRALGLL